MNNWPFDYLLKVQIKYQHIPEVGVFYANIISLKIVFFCYIIIVSQKCKLADTLSNIKSVTHLIATRVLCVKYIRTFIGKDDSDKHIRYFFENLS